MTNSSTNANVNAAIDMLTQAKRFMLAARDTGVTRTLNRTKLTVVKSDKQQKFSKSKTSVGMSSMPVKGTPYVFDNCAVLSLIETCESGFDAVSKLVETANEDCAQQMTINTSMHESLMRAEHAMQDLCKANFLGRLKFALFGPSKSLRTALHNLHQMV